MNYSQNEKFYRLFFHFASMAHPGPTSIVLVASLFAALEKLIRFIEISCTIRYKFITNILPLYSLPIKELM
jgi:hypothetical protein